ncbi:MAG TPA: chemotaxis protein CheA [Candidatus Sulfotelmatobacter sp.]|jgi:two-component system chemotaxis sensor kinase CheA|nr:chemotaxis protein CheA [Candidatus Sulfotelmatobacter sp.]
MNERLSKLTAQLQTEISAVRANDTNGQFPILDLIGNLRDEASKCRLAGLEKTCGDAWEKMVQIVESGKVFSPDDILWLNELILQVAAPADRTAAPADVPVANITETAPATDLLAETPPLELNPAEDAELLREFINESREHLDNIEQGVLVLENHPQDAETLNTVFRAFHTFKGGAGFLNLIPINRLAHILESLLDQARQGKLAIDAGVIGLILRGRDTLKNFVDEIDGQISGAKPCQPITIPTALLKREAQDVIDGKTSAAVAPKETLKNEPPAAIAETAEPGSTNSVHQTSIVKVDTAKLDGLLDLVGEMVIAQSLVSQHFAGMTGLSPQFTRDAAQLNRITKELQRVSMSLRMIPIRGVFQKMSRVVRDIGVKHNKKVELILSGEDTELDRGVVEELNDPLLHMIRNSMDHGIESAEKRTATGKPAQGTLHLRAYHQGGNIVVEVEDDGAGLSREKILKKAIERGLAAADDPLTDEEVFKFIFSAGFSTADKITDLSGRGVGLDVVRRNIERLRGRVEIESKLGTGTKFKISLPLTLAIIDGFIVRVGEERYIIPTLSVRESFRPQPGMVSKIQNKAEVVNVRGRLIPLLRLGETFGQPPTKNVTDGIAVVVESGAGVRCLLVDALLHKQEVVIKNLNEMMVHKNRLLAGAAILGDGRVGLILDVSALVNLDAHAEAELN